MRQPRIRRAHGLDQRLHHFRLDAIRQMPGIGHVGKTAPTIGDLLVLREHIGHQREGPQILCECLGERLSRRLAHRPPRILQQIERRLDRERLACDLEAQAGDGLVEQAIPRRIARHRFFVKELLDPILELIGLFSANVLEPRAIMRQRAVLHGRFELGVVEPIELEGEEQQMGRSGRDALLHVGVELRARGIDGVAGVEEPGIRHESAEKIIERLVARDRIGEHRPGIGLLRERRELTLVGVLEGEAFGSAAFEIAVDLRIIEPGVKISQIPFRQRAEAGDGRRLGRSTGGGAFCSCGHGGQENDDLCTTHQACGPETGACCCIIWRAAATGSTGH